MQRRHLYSRQNNPLYTSPAAGSIHASVWDVTSLEGLPQDVNPGTVDIVILVFVMSALHPDEWGQAINNIQKVSRPISQIRPVLNLASQMLKPGALVVFRDYGRHDLTQLRFKEGRLLEDNFYIRGDKTRVYFFTLGEMISKLLILNNNHLFSQMNYRYFSREPKSPQRSRHHKYQIMEVLNMILLTRRSSRKRSRARQ